MVRKKSELYSFHTEPIFHYSSGLESSNIYFYDGRYSSSSTSSSYTQPIAVASSIHSSPVHIMRYHPIAECVISVDQKGLIEYWDPSFTSSLSELKSSGSSYSSNSTFVVDDDEGDSNGAASHQEHQNEIIDIKFTQPKIPKIQWEFKSDTDLYIFRKVLYQTFAEYIVLSLNYVP